MKRRIETGFLVFALVLAVGCSVTPENKEVVDQQIIQIGDDANEVKAKIREWGWKAANHSWAYGITEWQGSPEATRALSEKRAERLRAENDFNDDPFYSVGNESEASVVELRGKNGVVVMISKRSRRDADWDWQGDFTSVTRNGVFKGEIKRDQRL